MDQAHACRSVARCPGLAGSCERIPGSVGSEHVPLSEGCVSVSPPGTGEVRVVGAGVHSAMHVLHCG